MASLPDLKVLHRCHRHFRKRRRSLDADDADLDVRGCRLPNDAGLLQKEEIKLTGCHLSTQPGSLRTTKTLCWCQQSMMSLLEVIKARLDHHGEYR